ncbi:MAG: VOC family protein [Tissierellia bacterium]|nr:VOC family protein [Tissierellia bacterium]
MGFRWVTLQVANMERSLGFYREIVGLETYRHIELPGREIYFLGSGETKLELICSQEIVDVSIGQSISLGFGVDSLEKKMDFIRERGLEIDSGPFSPNPSTSFFYILDPDGVRIQFIEEK